MAGSGMSLASIISASQQGAAQAMAMADSTRRENFQSLNMTSPEKKTLDPAAQAPTSGKEALEAEEAALKKEAMLSSHLDMGELMADLVSDSSVLANIMLPL